MVSMDRALNTQLAILRDSCKMWILKLMILRAHTITWQDRTSTSSLRSVLCLPTTSTSWGDRCTETTESLWLWLPLRLVSNTLRLTHKSVTLPKVLNSNPLLQLTSVALPTKLFSVQVRSLSTLKLDWRRLRHLVSKWLGLRRLHPSQFTRSVMLFKVYQRTASSLGFKRSLWIKVRSSSQRCIWIG